METVKKRKSWTIKKKLLILSEYREGEAGKGLPTLSKKYGISRETLRGWVDKKDELEAALKDRDVQSRRTRRLEGGGRKTPFVLLENALFDWIREKNLKGLKVKDAYIKAKALTFHHDMREHPPEADNADIVPLDCTALTGWLSRFKRRRDLVSRRRTTTRTLPEDADEIARQFIQTVHALIDKHKIQSKNVLNMDQVPRYFEVENGSTITLKGSKQVVLRKGGTQHKRFTATFLVNAAGDFLRTHVLFSKLRNMPRVPGGILCDVNETGMWNEDILWRYIQANILSRRETTFSREPVLLILDSYGTHLSLVASGKLTAYNVFTALVPERLTPVTQPLDVGLNRGFQQSYAAKFDLYISRALEDPALQTVQGNPKVPNYFEVSEWVMEWVASVSRETVIKSFVSCGLLPDSFEMDNLHLPLRELLSGDYTMESWAGRHAQLLRADNGEVQRIYLPPEWYLPEVTLTSLFECILVKLHRDTLEERSPNADEIAVYRRELIAHMEAQRELQDISDAEYYDDLRAGRCYPGELELFAISQSEKVDIDVFNDLTKTSFRYICPGALLVIDLVRLDDYFLLSMQGAHLVTASP